MQGGAGEGEKEQVSAIALIGHQGGDAFRFVLGIGREGYSNQLPVLNPTLLDSEEVEEDALGRQMRAYERFRQGELGCFEDTSRHETFAVVSNTLGSHEGNEDDIARKYPSEGFHGQDPLASKYEVVQGERLFKYTTKGASSEEVDNSNETSFRGKRDNDWTVVLIRRLPKCNDDKLGLTESSIDKYLPQNYIPCADDGHGAHVLLRDAPRLQVQLSLNHQLWRASTEGDIDEAERLLNLGAEVNIDFWFSEKAETDSSNAELEIYWQNTMEEDWGRFGDANQVRKVAEVLCTIRKYGVRSSPSQNQTPKKRLQWISSALRIVQELKMQSWFLYLHH
ncbi:hypothetical protein GUITHDRAFT_142478 [Guillardia theta CCMP2712]|uniref:Uncharacterized protein n=1 Tax=Guillardia theta (strain CCMP2712) TaxID=905079 RepID=L1IYA3_GUITC|nr:hypothetical protein GUITHDRAFT_142478 [Guillardia theta CCMP2712]EKX40864.1 hypothetical protein GUITHDRAFT_142478 [Guillardia theta CCMP2712]|eukprot:XP_005827844.1 hypothetical protein GUITHDRAFT_142478 [Guillardia theta CCMP2712]